MKITCYHENNNLQWQPEIDTWQKNMTLLQEQVLTQLPSHLMQITKLTNFQMILIDKKEMKELNFHFRKINRVTDVLTFYDSYLIDNQENYSADIFICLDVAITQAQKQNISLSQELSLLSIHGLLHGIGFDHEKSENDKNEMHQYEKTLLKSLKISQDISLIQ